MSSILKGLNESNSVYGHSDPDREYGAPATSYGKRGPYYQTDDDDDGNPFAEYERQQRMFAQGRADKAKKEKAQRDADHDRLATGTNEEQLDELSNEKLAKYKTAAAADAGKADIAGDYKKADRRFSGIVKATKKQFANDTKTVKEAEGQKEYILYINNKPAAKYVDQLQAERDMASVKKKHPQVRIELKHEVCDLETVKRINENQLMSKALLEAKSLLIQLDESTQQQVINTLKKNVDDEKDAFKNVYPRVNNPKILGTQNRAKSIYYPPSKPNVKKLDKPLPESLGDELKSKSLQALEQVKQQIAQQRMADLEQWEKDFKQNTVAKFTARQPSFMQQQPKQVAKPLEKHSVLKARLAQLNKAIEKQAILDKMLQRLDNKGLLTPAIQSDTDTSMLVRDGASDNYVSLNQKLDKALEFVKNRLLTNKAAFAKPKAIDEAQEIKFVLVVDGEAKFKFPTREEALKVLKDYKAQFPKANVKVEPRAVAKTMYEELDENLHQWFKEKWVRFGPDGKIRGACARGDDSEGKPKCLPQSKAHSLGKKGRASAAARKRREDPNPERSGKAINVNTKKKTDESEGNFAGDTPVNLGGVSVKNLGIGDIVSYLGQKAKILAMSKTGNTSRIVIPSSMGSITKDVLTKDLKRTSLSEEELDEACWKGYHKEGNKKMFGKTYPNCVKNTNEEQEQHSETCPHCGGEMVSEELMNEKKDACYYKVKSRYKVWPSAYASGALVKCRKKGASNWGNGGKSNESIEEGVVEGLHPMIIDDVKKLATLNPADRYSAYSNIRGYFKADPELSKMASDLMGGYYEADMLRGKYKTDAAKAKYAELEPMHQAFIKRVLGQEQGVAEDQLDEKWSKKYKDSINCSNPKGFSQKAHCVGKKKNESAILKGLK